MTIAKPEPSKITKIKIDETSLAARSAFREKHFKRCLETLQIIDNVK
jgi:hypothetical protein